jgi:hypothetical protein
MGMAWFAKHPHCVRPLHFVISCHGGLTSSLHQINVVLELFVKSSF